MSSGLSIIAMVAVMTSFRLCGGMFVAMPTAMPDEPLTSRFGNAGRKNLRLRQVVVEVRREVDRVLVDVREQLGRDPHEPRFGVAIRRGRIAVHRAEVSLPVDQRIAQRKVLHHADERVVHRAVAVRVESAKHVAHDRRRLLERPVRQRGRGRSSRTGCDGVRA